MANQMLLEQIEAGLRDFSTDMLRQLLQAHEVTTATKRIARKVLSERKVTVGR